MTHTEAGAEHGDPGVLAPATSGATGFFERFGGDPDRIFGRAGISPDAVPDPTRELSLKSYCQLFEEAARQTGHDNIGLWFGHQFAPRDLGLWGYAAVCSTNLGGALHNLVELFAYHQQGSTMRLSRHDGLLSLEYRIHDGRIVERRQDAELSLGMFLNVFREGLGRGWTPVHVCFEHPRPEGWREHERAFDAPVSFNQPTNALVFRPELLERPMPGRDLRLLAIVQTCLVSLRGAAAGPHDVPFIERLRNQVRRRLAEGYPSAETVAADMRIGVGTLRRLLAGEGLSYRQFVEDTRRGLAMVYLPQLHLTLSEIAFLLGYSELSAFSRAFSRWTGVSPRTWRAGRSLPQ